MLSFCERSTAWQAEYIFCEKSRSAQSAQQSESSGAHREVGDSSVPCNSSESVMRQQYAKQRDPNNAFLQYIAKGPNHDACGCLMNKVDGEAWGSVGNVHCANTSLRAIDEGGDVGLGAESRYSPSQN